LSKGEHAIKFKLDPVESRDAEGREADKKGTFVKLRIPTARIEGPQDPRYWGKPDGYERFFHLDEPPVGTAGRRQYATEVFPELVKQ